jgi:hypothetical protein
MVPAEETVYRPIDSGEIIGDGFRVAYETFRQNGVVQIFLSAASNHPVTIAIDHGSAQLVFQQFTSETSPTSWSGNTQSVEVQHVNRSDYVVEYRDVFGVSATVSIQVVPGEGRRVFQRNMKIK